MIHQSLECAGLNVKHVQKMAAERDPVLRAVFVHKIGEYPVHYLISIDKVSKDDWTYTCLWGCAPVGQRAEQHAPFVHKHRYSMITSLALDNGIIASRALEGSLMHKTSSSTCVMMWGVCIYYLSTLAYFFPLASSYNTISRSLKCPSAWQCTHTSFSRGKWPYWELWYVGFQYHEVSYLNPSSSCIFDVVAYPFTQLKHIIMNYTMHVNGLHQRWCGDSFSILDTYKGTIIFTMRAHSKLSWSFVAMEFWYQKKKPGMQP